jgi:hypothetical protein
MPEDVPRPAPSAIRTNLGAISVSLELSRKTWLITSLSPGAGDKMSRHSVVRAGQGLRPASDLQSCRLSRGSTPDATQLVV